MIEDVLLGIYLQLYNKKMPIAWDSHLCQSIIKALQLKHHRLLERRD
jgi:hypothetical protein